MFPTTMVNLILLLSDNELMILDFGGLLFCII